MNTDVVPATAIKDSGTRRAFGTGSVRDAAKGKGRFDLMPIRAMFRLAKHFELGCEKYGPDNWAKGQPLSVFYDSGVRHLLKHFAGLRDEDHLAAALWNISCMVDTEERIREGVLPKELDDLPAVIAHLPPSMFPTSTSKT